MNQLSISRRAQILQLLTEGLSMRAAARIVGCSYNTVTPLLVDAGKACQRYQNEVLVNLSCKFVQCDEIWAFCGCKERNVTPDRKAKGHGDAWTWIAMCADTKLAICWRVGSRTVWDARYFMEKLASRLANRVQLSTDGLISYPDAVERSFGTEVDYGTIIKLFGKKLPKEYPDIKYSQPLCTGITKNVIKGNPAKSKISTSYIERYNLTVRMADRRFTRLTNAFSKKLYNLRCSVALHMMHYNFCRVHGTLRVTPAMEAGVSDHIWEMKEVVELIDRFSN
jgi:IS1 family transposase